MGCCTGAKNSNVMKVKFSYKATGKIKSPLEIVMAAKEVVRTPLENSKDEVSKQGKESSRETE